MARNQPREPDSIALSADHYIIDVTRKGIDSRMLHKEGYKLNNSLFEKGQKEHGFQLSPTFVIIIIVKTDSAKEYL